MGIIRNDKSPYELYENTVLGILVAINRADTKLIKQYFKNKKKKDQQVVDSIKGFAFVLDEEVDSLKIDFSKELMFKIEDLQKFKA